MYTAKARSTALVFCIGMKYWERDFFVGLFCLHFLLFLFPAGPAAGTLLVQKRQTENQPYSIFI